MGQFDDFGNVRGLVADALHIRDDLQCRGNIPQIGGHGLLLQKQLQAHGFDLPFLLVDLLGKGRDRPAQQRVALGGGLGGQGNGLFAQGPHGDQFFVQQLQLFVKFASHINQTFP